ncbi:uncharacterized protein DSM5745_07768 [Aspergillus mulundensis]|uniref:Rhodopsin domain-containing protein n=1 Tax=Aspergillus mulundensis TaxID=1810919 RepID=A0A3D8RF62_9EURO|nr:Uncharacterized protein DSM5745_07768 [Aspergillus mulundensis]RDW72596.1 Uncharacterized protein DSM5745_07768 [Aspergillus mulundensis]
MSTAEGLSPFQQLSSDNRGPIVTLVSVCLLIVAVIFVLAKFGSAIYFKQRRTAVNTPIWVALILSIIQVVVLQKAVDNGLGRHEDRLSESQIQTLSKASRAQLCHFRSRTDQSQFSFAAQLLLLIVLSLTKLSTILLIWKLTPSKSLRLHCTITAGVVVGWTIFALFGISFQCQLPEAWLYRPERCAGEGALFYPIAVVNILTEIVLVVLPFIMMQNVQMAAQKRVKILCSFSSRLCVVGLAIAHLAVLPSFVRSNDITCELYLSTLRPQTNRTGNSTLWHVIGQAMMLTSVTIACVPTLYHIFAGLHSGLITTQIQLPDSHELSRTGTGKYAKTKTSAYINQTSSSGDWAGGSGNRTRGRSREREQDRGRGNGRARRDSSLFDPRNVDTAVVTEITTTNHNHNETQGAMMRSSSSSEGTESTRRLTQEAMGKQGVMRTVDITVEIEDQHPRMQEDRGRF